MSRKIPTPLFTKTFLILLTFVFATLLTLDLASGGAQSILTEAVVVPGDVTPSVSVAVPQRSSLAVSTAAIVTSVSSQTVARSGYFKVTGSNFGVSQDSSSQLLVNNLSAIVVRWNDTEIVGYVPEGSILGSVPVQVATAAGTSNTTNVNVTTRQSNGRIRWRVELTGDYAFNGAVVAPPGVPGAGTIYVATNAGFLYAWNPDGALKWVAPGADGDTQTSIGADGTIYTGGTDDSGSPAVVAWNPNGTQKWVFADPNGQSVRAGPNVGPDGKIYVIFRPLNAQSLNFAAIRPDGSLAWFVNRNFYKYGQFGGKELAFGRTTQHVYFAFDVDPDPDPTFTNGGFFAYDFDGHLVWERGGLCCGVPAVAPDEDLRHGGMRMNAQTGATVYAFNFPPYGTYGTDGLPDVGPTNIHYVINSGRLWAINPNGSQKWRYDPLNPDGSFFWLGSPNVNPTNTAILIGGGGNYGQDSLFLSVDPTTGQEQWRQVLAREPGYEPYGNFYFAPQAVFSADGNTGYMAADINGDQNWPFQQKHCVLYAVNTGASGGPINQPPQVTITNPLTNSNVARNTPVNVTAQVQDDGAIDRVEFLYAHNGISVAIGTDTTPDANGLYSASFTPTDPGGYGIYAVAYDTGGLRGDAPYVSIIVNNEAPHINWVSPANGAVFTAPPSITLTAHATDVDGTVTKVDFNSSAVGLLGTDTTADASGNYTIVWTNPPVGSHNLYAWATDNDGYRIEAIITVTVNSGGSVVPVSISGRFTSQSGAGLTEVSVDVTPASGQAVTGKADANGNYSFTNLAWGGSYVITPSKASKGGDVTGISALDASLAARYAANLISLTPNQQIAADASGNGSITAFDATLIARTAAGIPNAGIAGAWKFTPQSLTFNNLTTDKVNQDFSGILVGDVSGNWSAQPTTPEGSEQKAVSAQTTSRRSSQSNAASASPSGTIAIPVSLPIKQDPPGGPSTIPITVGDTTAQGIGAYAFDISFNPAVLQLQATPFDATGTLTPTNGSWLVTPNTATPGHLILNAFGTSDLTGQGVLLNLKFNVIGGAGSTSPLTWVNFTFNEGTPADTDLNGFFTATAPTAALAGISGQIVTADGQPVGGVTVAILGGLGGARTIRAITDSNGYYRVENLEVGGFYTVTPSRANYVFAPANRSFSLVGNKTDAVFTGTTIEPDGNPLESPEFFVRQQYLDFLGREPEQSGLDYWSGQLRACGQNVDCIETRRLDISAAFFIAQEFQDSGLYIYDVYEGALGRRPDHAEYAVDRRSVVGGPRLEADKAAFAASFVERAEFNAQYPLTMGDEVFVDALLRTAQQSSGIDLSGARAGLLNLYNSGANTTESRSLVVRSVAEGSRFKQTQYNPAFVLMEYYGYLGRNPDREGYDFWLNVLNDGDRNNYRGMVCSFITSAEYQRRFSSIVTRSNAECGQ